MSSASKALATKHSMKAVSAWSTNVFRTVIKMDSIAIQDIPIASWAMFSHEGDFCTQMKFEMPHRSSDWQRRLDLRSATPRWIYPYLQEPAV
jgi:hypothetical protein